MKVFGKHDFALFLSSPFLMGVLALLGAGAPAQEQPLDDALKTDRSTSKVQVEADPLSSPLDIALSDSGKKSAQTKERNLDLDQFRKMAHGNEDGLRAWSGLSAGRRVQVLVLALEGGSEVLRRKAVTELRVAMTAELGEEAYGVAIRALAQAAVRERLDEVREQAYRAWQGIARGEGPQAKQAIGEMGKGLDLGNPIEKKRVFDALKEIGGKDVLEVMITKITTTWGQGPRGHIMIAHQRSYIADYDVSGAVFDPVIRSFLVGVVLDNQAMQIKMIRYVIDELRRLGAREAEQADPRLWQAFIEKKMEEGGH